MFKRHEPYTDNKGANWYHENNVAALMLLTAFMTCNIYGCIVVAILSFK